MRKADCAPEPGTTVILVDSARIALAFPETVHWIDKPSLAPVRTGLGGNVPNRHRRRRNDNGSHANVDYHQLVPAGEVLEAARDTLIVPDEEPPKAEEEAEANPTTRISITGGSFLPLTLI